MRAFDVVGQHGRYMILDNGEQIAGPYTYKWRAEQVSDQLEAKARRSVRRCISCSASFESDGPHHRMCDNCRAAKRENVPFCSVRKARPVRLFS